MLFDMHSPLGQPFSTWATKISGCPTGCKDVCSIRFNLSWNFYHHVRSHPCKGRNLVIDFLHLHHSHHSYNEDADCTHHREDKTARERTSNLLANAEAKKMKSLALHTHICLKTSFRDYSSSIMRTSFLYLFYSQPIHPVVIHRLRFIW